jgi:hypothetical protein
MSTALPRVGLLLLCVVLSLHLCNANEYDHRVCMLRVSTLSIPIPAARVSGTLFPVKL